MPFISGICRSISVTSGWYFRCSATRRLILDQLAIDVINGSALLRDWVDGFWSEALARFKAAADASARSGGTS
jgi:hypothetical protein